MKEKYLPIGTIVLLNKAKSYLMITSYFIFSKQGKTGMMYDYGGCPFPIGILNSESTYVFNHEDIKEVIYMGYENDEQKRFAEILKDGGTQIKEKYIEEMSKIEKKEA